MSLQWRAQTENKGKRRSTAGGGIKWHSAAGDVAGGRRGHVERGQAELNSLQRWRRQGDVAVLRQQQRQWCRQGKEPADGSPTGKTGGGTRRGRWVSLEAGGGGWRRSLVKTLGPPTWWRQGAEKGKREIQTPRGGLKPNGQGPNGLDQNGWAQSCSPGSGSSDQWENSVRRVRQQE